MEKIDKLDLKILSIISANARIPFKDVAAECDLYLRRYPSGKRFYVQISRQGTQKDF